MFISRKLISPWTWMQRRPRCLSVEQDHWKADVNQLLLPGEEAWSWVQVKLLRREMLFRKIPCKECWFASVPLSRVWATNWRQTIGVVPSAPPPKRTHARTHARTHSLTCKYLVTHLLTLSLTSFFLLFVPLAWRRRAVQKNHNQ